MGDRGYLGRFHASNFNFEGKGMPQQAQWKPAQKKRRTLTEREIEALRKRNQDAAGFDLYAQNGYYHNYVKPEPRREYSNVARPCVGCKGLYSSEEERRRQPRGRVIPLAALQRPRTFVRAGERDTFDGLNDDSQFRVGGFVDNEFSD